MTTSELVPTGKLRAAINFGNPVLAGKDVVTGEPCGISVDLARELARRLGVSIELVHYAIAGVKPQLEAHAARVPGLRMLPGQFMAINQAMGTPRVREAGAAYLREFVDKMKTSGFVARAFASNRITGASMAA